MTRPPRIAPRRRALPHALAHALAATLAFVLLAPAAAQATPVAPIRTLNATVKPAYEDVWSSWTVEFRDDDMDFLISYDEIVDFSGILQIGPGRLYDQLIDVPGWVDVADGSFEDGDARPAWRLLETGGGGGSAPANRFTYFLSAGGGPGAEIPLPAPAALLAGGLGALALLRRRKTGRRAGPPPA